MKIKWTHPTPSLAIGKKKHHGVTYHYSYNFNRETVYVNSNGLDVNTKNLCATICEASAFVLMCITENEDYPR